MTQIADPDKFYKVSSYDALKDIQSSLQQNLTDIEGKKVCITHYTIEQRKAVLWIVPMLKSDWMSCSLDKQPL